MDEYGSLKEEHDEEKSKDDGKKKNRTKKTKKEKAVRYSSLSVAEQKNFLQLKRRFKRNELKNQNELNAFLNLQIIVKDEQAAYKAKAKEAWDSSVPLFPVCLLYTSDAADE